MCALLQHDSIQVRKYIYWLFLLDFFHRSFSTLVASARHLDRERLDCRSTFLRAPCGGVHREFSAIKRNPFHIPHVATPLSSLSLSPSPRFQKNFTTDATRIALVALHRVYLRGCTRPRRAPSGVVSRRTRHRNVTITQKNHKYIDIAKYDDTRF